MLCLLWTTQSKPRKAKDLLEKKITELCFQFYQRNRSCLRLAFTSFFQCTEPSSIQDLNILQLETPFTRDSFFIKQRFEKIKKLKAGLNMVRSVILFEYKKSTISEYKNLIATSLQYSCADASKHKTATAKFRNSTKIAECFSGYESE